MLNGANSLKHIARFHLRQSENKWEAKSAKQQVTHLENDDASHVDSISDWTQLC